MPRTQSFVTSVPLVVFMACAASLTPQLAHSAGASALTVAPLAVFPSTAALPGDFNGDGFSDLAVGVPLEDVGAIEDAGAVNVLFGSATGLTAAGSQFWHQDKAGIAGDGAEAGDGFGYALAAGDFNGDGFSDLGVGVPFEDIGATFDAGAVNVLYGSAAGLTSAESQFWHQGSAGMAGDGAEAFDGFGSSLAADDFGNSAEADLAVGVQHEAVGSIDGAGAINVLYGSGTGLTTSGSQFWHQASPGVRGSAEFGDQFGWSLAAADFGSSSEADLAVGVPSENLGHLDDAGAVNVLMGSPAGLDATGNQIWHQKYLDVSGTAEEGDAFGFSLAAANFGGSSEADLAIGVLNEGVGRAFFTGAANVLYGSMSGLTSTGDQLWHQNSPGVTGWAETGDGFGFSLAAGNFGNTSEADLAVGVPFESLGRVVEAGAANVLYGSASGITATGNQLWDQNSPSVEDTAEEGDGFGWSLAAANFGNSAHADLAVGVVFERVGGIRGAGAVAALYGSGAGLTASGNQFWHQGIPGVDGDGAEADDEFGRSLAPNQ